MRFRLRFVLIFAVVVLAGCLAASPALPSVPAQAADQSAYISVTSISPAILTKGGQLTILGTVTNEGTSAINGAEIDLQLSDKTGPLTDRGLLSAWQADRTIDQWGWNALAVKLPASIKPGQAEPFTLTIGADKLPLSRQAAGGAFPCRLDVATAQGVVGVLRTFIVFQATTDIAPVTISTLVPALSNPQRSADNQSLTGAADQASIDAATALITAGSQAPVDWLIDPALVQATDSDASTKKLLDALRASQESHDVFRLPWADIDVSAVAQAGAHSLYEFAAAQSKSAFTAHKLSDAGLIVWPPFGRLDSATASLLSSQDPPKAIALASSPLESDAFASHLTSAHASITVPAGTLTSLVADDTLTALIAQSDTSQALEWQRLVAELATIADQNPGHSKSVLVLPDRAWSDHFGQLKTNLAKVATLPWIQTERTSTLLKRASTSLEASTSSASTTGGAMAPSLVSQIDDAVSKAELYASVTPNPAATLAPLARPLLYPLSVTMRDQPTAREGFALGAIDQVRRTAETISVKQGSDIMLISRSGAVPIAVTNTGAQPVTVTVKLESPDRRLRVPDSKVLTVKPNSEERAQLTFEAITSGDVEVEVLALNKAGDEVADRATMKVRVRADWEDVGTLIVGILVAGLLVFGLIRSRRRKRAERMKATT